MLIQLIIFLFLGILTGTITGLFPGIHINLVGAMLVALSFSIFSSINPLFLVVFIVSVAIAHTFFDFIPSIFLGASNEDTALSVLPGHEMLKEGFGYQAVYLTMLGAVFGTIILIFLSFPFVALTPKIYNFIKPLIPFLLIAVSLGLIFSEEKKFSALFIFLLSGILGLIVLNLDFVKEPLLPMLSGLFGASTLILSIKAKTQIPKQNTEEKIKTNLFKPLLASAIASPLTIFLPALGSGQISIIGNQISRTDRRGFLLLQGSVNILTMGFSFLSLYTISKARTGAAVAVQNLIGIPEKNSFILILIVILISGIISFFLCLKTARIFATILEKINYTKLSIFTLILVSIVVLVFSGFFGFFIFIVSTFTGVYGILSKVRRTNLMGCLLLPTIVLYLI